MKALLKITTTAVLMTIATISMAAKNPTIAAKIQTAQSTVKNYVDIVKTGYFEHAEQLLMPEFTQNIHCKSKNIYSAKEFVDFAKRMKGTKLECKTSVKMIEESDDYAVAKITMNFGHFSKTDCVTLVRNPEGWKVVNSVVTY